MNKQLALAALRQELGETNVVTDPEELLCYGYDATPDLPEGKPDVVVTPQTTEQVAQVLKIARRFRLPVYPRGAGTNLSGGTVPLRGGIVLCTVKMNRILEIDPVNLTATVQPGVIIQELNQAVAPHGLIYPPDPGTVATATMGGSVAECSGGLRGLKYGVTRNYVMGLEVVLANGEVLRCGGKTVKNVTGYDLVRLFTGSEGTLGVITEITVRLIPAPPCRETMLAGFAQLADAGNTVTHIIQHKVIPATLEIMDRVTVEVVESYARIGLPTDVAALLLIEIDGIPEVVQREAETVREIVLRNGGWLQTAADDVQREKLLAARRAALPALARVKPTTILEDATVPRSEITTMLLSIEEIACKYRLTIGTFGHAGDGNLHPTILADARDPEEMQRVRSAVEEIFRVALSLGGTLTGEHGIGIAKQRFLPWEMGETGLWVLRQIKRALDPDYLLNPDKLVPQEGGEAN
ncbi:FAD-binding oxidoreductase [Desulfothermobacter acidiphilus]|uniref:FAD-binding oxidoreductase n=1 Tax=Desulfothermobacter acidiphilus TaxID=1938353 RepID=UPI003F8CF136